MARRLVRLRASVVVLGVVLLFGLAGATGYLVYKNRDLNNQLNLTTEQKNTRLIEEINKVYKLPDETPVVAIVTNPDDFKTQYPSFTDAQNGDYLLFFRKNRLNVLYRQSEKRVVTTADVVIPIAVELVGSQTDVDATAKQLTDFGTQISITKTVKDGIAQSYVYDVDADQSAQAKSIADQLKYSVGTTLPSDISPSDSTEIIVVVSGASSNGSSSSGSSSGAPTTPQP